MTTVTLSASAVVAVPVDDAFDRVLPHPLPEIFRHRRLAIPPITEVRGQEGEWGRVGQSRTIVTADGGTLLETLTTVDRPDRFDYTIATMSGPMKLLVRQAEGSWAFESTADGTRITWTWVLTPTAVGRVAMPAFGAMWRGYARQALAEVDRILVSGPRE